ncbi:unknown [Roseburia sp. CAG:182]|nr:unknown [Roseburia sp. CAG:182]
MLRGFLSFMRRKIRRKQDDDRQTSGGNGAGQQKIHCGECSAHVVLPGGKYRYDVRDRLTVTETFFKNCGQPGHRSLCRSCGSSQCGALFSYDRGKPDELSVCPRGKKDAARTDLSEAFKTGDVLPGRIKDVRDRAGGG